MLTAQWHAELISQARPDSMCSNAPRFTSTGAWSVVETVGWAKNAFASARTNS